MTDYYKDERYFDISNGKSMQAKCEMCEKWYGKSKMKKYMYLHDYYCERCYQKLIYLLKRYGYIKKEKTSW